MDNMPDTTAKELSAVDLAYNGIIDLVLKRELRPGERTSVYLLVDRLQIGRTPVREAINRLQSEGFLSVAGRSGTVVNQIDRVQASQLFALRLTLETFAADYAVRNVTGEDLQNLTVAVEKLGSAGSSADFVRANTEFHSAIVALAANPTLMRFYAQLQIQLHVVSYLAERGPDAEAATARHREHLDILAALVDRDADALKAALKSHIRTTERAILGK
ncbi:GntR family transcriptional regulator [Mesorhizobium sp. M0047]|uniref:GntR family transcriptional regulator n=1 Tax=Mesorhizobium sp. M0047 TaxID=2956859 RepID=UPI003338F530